MSKPTILLLTPFRRGEGYSPGAGKCLLELGAWRERTGVELRGPVHVVGGAIDSARAELWHMAKSARWGNRVAPARASHALFHDSDVELLPEHVQAMVDVFASVEGADALCVPYPTRHASETPGAPYAWVLHQAAVAVGERHTPTLEGRDLRTVAGHRLVSLARAGLGACMVRVGLIERLEGAHPELCGVKSSATGRTLARLFETWTGDNPAPGGGVERVAHAEDFSVCERITAAGMRLEAFADLHAGHKGLTAAESFGASLGLPALAAQ